MIQLSSKTYWAAAVAGLSFSSPVWAEVTADEIGKRLNRVLAGQATTFSWDAVEGSGSSFVLKNVRASSQQAGSQPVTIGDVPLSDVTEMDDGDYRIGRVEVPSMSRSQNGVDAQMSEIVFEGMRLTGETSTDPLAGGLLADRTSIAHAGVSRAGQKLFELQNLTYSVNRSADLNEMTYECGADKFSSDMSGAKDPGTQAVLSQLQLTQISGKLECAGNWSLNTGITELTQFDILVENQGKIGLTVTINGYTRDLFKAMTGLQQKAAEAATPEQAQAQGAEMIGLMQKQLNLVGATLRYDDASFAMRALEMAAATQNARAADLPATAQMLMPMVLPQYLPAELVQPVTAEVVKFLKDPKSLEIKLNPPQPLPLQALVTAGSDPKAAVKNLGLSVKVNQ